MGFKPVDIKNIDFEPIDSTPKTPKFKPVNIADVDLEPVKSPSLTGLSVAGTGVDVPSHTSGMKAKALPPTPGSDAEIFGRKLRMGLQSVGGGIGELAEMTGIPGVKQAGRWVADTAANVRKNIEGSITPEQMPKNIFTPESKILEPDTWDTTEGLKPRDIVLQGAEQIAQFLPGVAAAKATKGASVIKKIATQAGVGAAQSAGVNAAQSYQEIMEMPEETLLTSPEYNELLKANTPEIARKKLATSIRNEVALKTAPTGAAAGPLEFVLPSALAGRMLTRGLKGAGISALTEVPQEITEELIQNLAQKRADVSIDPQRGLLEAGAMAGIVGGAPGAYSAISQGSNVKGKKKDTTKKTGIYVAPVPQPKPEVSTNPGISDGADIQEEIRETQKQPTGLKVPGTTTAAPIPPIEQGVEPFGVQDTSGVKDGAAYQDELKVALNPEPASGLKIPGRRMNLAEPRATGFENDLGIDPAEEARLRAARRNEPPVMTDQDFIAQMEEGRSGIEALPSATGLSVPGIATAVDEKAHEAATSPLNEISEPTKSQIEADNYKKGHPVVNGMKISIENAEGSTRKDKLNDPPKWESTMVNAHYGDIKGTSAKGDGQLDVFLKPGTPEKFEGQAYIINQVDPETGKFDELKTMIGYSSEEEAQNAYMSNYQPGWKGLKSIVPMSIDEFKTWTKEGNTKKELKPTQKGVPVNEVSEVRSEDVGEEVQQVRQEDVKEPWEMTAAEYVSDRQIAYATKRKGSSDKILGNIGQDALRRHGKLIEQALSEGKQIPAEVLADYPDLQKGETPDGLREKTSEETDDADAEKRQVVTESKLGSSAPLEAVVPGTESQEIPVSYEGEERRKNIDLREDIDKMTDAEKNYALLHDPLTGLKNRRAFQSFEKANNALPEAERQTIGMIDIDGFKAINDMFGHDKGDEYLREIARVVKELGMSKHVYRIGGDELAFRSVDPATAKQMMDTLSKAFREASIEVEIDGIVNDLKGVGFSYGYGKGRKEADRNLYRHKEERTTAGLRIPTKLSREVSVTPRTEARQREDEAGESDVQVSEEPEVDESGVEEAFLRAADAKEKVGGVSRSSGFNTLPEAPEGFENVYKPYGEQGAGYYRIPKKEDGVRQADVPSVQTVTESSETAAPATSKEKESILPEGLKPVMTIESFLKTGEKSITLAEVKRLRNVKSGELSVNAAAEILRNKGITVEKKAKKATIEESPAVQGPSTTEAAKEAVSGGKETRFHTLEIGTQFMVGEDLVEKISDKQFKFVETGKKRTVGPNLKVSGVREKAKAQDKEVDTEKAETDVSTTEIKGKTGTKKETVSPETAVSSTGESRGESETKQAWEMTFVELKKSDYPASAAFGNISLYASSPGALNQKLNALKKRHKKIIEQALSEGRTVPENVLADYPDLQKKARQKEANENLKGPSKRKKETVDRLKEIRDFYTPGNIVTGYAGQRDKVLDFEEGEQFSGGWNVKVQEIDKDGNLTGRPRNHATPPSRGYRVVSRGEKSENEPIEPKTKRDLDLRNEEVQDGKVEVVAETSKQGVYATNNQPYDRLTRYEIEDSGAKPPRFLLFRRDYENGVLRGSVLLDDAGSKAELKMPTETDFENAGKFGRVKKEWDAARRYKQAEEEHAIEQNRIADKRQAIISQAEEELSTALKKKGLLAKAKKNEVPQDVLDAIKNPIKDKWKSKVETATDELNEWIKNKPKYINQRTKDLFEEEAAEAKPVEQETEKQEKAGSRSSSKPKAERIEDFGEKVGGARKDTASRGDTAASKSKGEDDSAPAWRKKYVAMEKKDGTGWIIATGTKENMRGIAGLHEKFATKEEAEKAIPLFAIADKHYASPNSDGIYSIYKKVSDRKRIKVVNQDFASREDAMKYMAQHAEEILNIKTTFGEEILPVPEIAIRKGTERRTGPATPEMFMETFAPRAIEFGNWNNQEERQQVMNHAYDGLLDLAEVLGLSPKALMLNGELAIAFGARGQGLTGAKAHYEPDYGIINLTKMKGAGSLGHEWLHSLDHYLARLDSKASSEKVKNKRGDLVYKQTSDKYDMQSHGPSYKSQMREELRTAFKDLVDLMYQRAEQYVEDTQIADKFLGKARENLRDRLNDVRKTLEADYTQWKKKNGKPASAEQLAEFDRLADSLVEGGNLETKWVYSKPNASLKDAGAMSGRHSNDTLESINALLKAVKGRQGFNSERTGVLNYVVAAMNTYKTRIKMFEDAQTGTEKTKKVPTSYAIEARKMDQARTGDYWSEPHEMAARAFAAYVEDKISDQGGQSDFLVYHAHGGILLPMIDGFIARPYPEGKERIAINKAFDKFIQTIQTKETEKGVALYGGGPSTEEILTALRTAKNALPHLTNLAKNVIREGYVKYKDFSVRMKKLLGDMWQKFRQMVPKVHNLAKKELRKESEQYVQNDTRNKEGRLYAGRDSRDVEMVGSSDSGRRRLDRGYAVFSGEGIGGNDGRDQRVAMRPLAETDQSRKGSDKNEVQPAKEIGGVSEPGSERPWMDGEAITDLGYDTGGIKRLRESISKFERIEVGRTDMSEVSLRGENSVVLRRIAQSFGKRIRYFRSRPTPILSRYMALMDSKDAGNIWISIDSPAPHLEMLGHELMHHLQIDDPQLFNEFKVAITPDINEGEYRKYVIDMMKDGDFRNSDQAQREFTAEFIQQKFLDAEFWSKLQINEPTIFEKVIGYVKSLLDRAIKAYGRDIDNRFIRDINRARQIAADTLAEYAKRQQREVQPAKEIGGVSEPGSERPWMDGETVYNLGYDTGGVKTLREKISKFEGIPVEREAISEVSVRGENATVIRRIAQIFGKRVRFFRIIGGHKELSRYTGVQIPSDPKVIWINGDSNEPHLQILGHELMHSLQTDDPALFNDFSAAMTPYIRHDKYWNYINELKESGKDFRSNFQAQSEFSAEFIGQKFLDPGFWQEVESKDVPVFRQIMGHIRRLLNKVMSYFGGRDIDNRFIADIERAREIAADTMAEYAKRQQGKGKTSLQVKTPFYSQLRKVIETQLPGMVSTKNLKAVLNDPKNSKGINGIKAEEIKDSGVFAIFGDKKVMPKKEILDYLDAVDRTDVQDVVLGGKLTSNEQAEYEVLLEKSNNFDITQKEVERFNKLIDKNKSENTFFGSYTMPGAIEGSYREQFVTARDQGVSGYKIVEEDGKFIIKEADGSFLDSAITREEAQRKLEEYAKYPDELSAGWRDGHSQYSSIRNPIVRIRFNDRLDSQGNLVRFIEELQGPNPDNEAKMPEVYRKFKYQIGLKRILQGIAEENIQGAERGEQLITSLSWTPGSVQAERYDLSKQVDSVDITRSKYGSYDISAMKDGTAVIHKAALKPDELENLIGKDLAKKAIEQPSGKHTYSGLDLRVGGLGLARLYDQTIPTFLGRYAEQWGVKVVETQLGDTAIAQIEDGRRFTKQTNGSWVWTPDDEIGEQEVFENLNALKKEYNIAKIIKTGTVPSLPITPQMQSSILREGQPLFQISPDNLIAAISKSFPENNGKTGAMRRIGEFIKSGKITEGEVELSGISGWLEAQKENIKKSDIINAIRRNYEQTVRQGDRGMESDSQGKQGVDSVGNRTSSDRAKTNTLERILVRQYGDRVKVRIPDKANIPHSLQKISELVAPAWGRKVIAVDVQGLNVGGLINNADPQTIFIDVKNKRPDLQTFGHEIVEGLYQIHPDLYAKLEEFASEYMRDFEGYKERLDYAYASQGMAPLSKENVMKDLIADFVGDRMTTRSFWDNIARKEPTLFQRMINIVRDLIDRIKTRFGTAVETDQVFRKIKKVQEVAEDVLLEHVRRLGEEGVAGQGEFGVSYSMTPKEGAGNKPPVKASMPEGGKNSPEFKKWFHDSKVTDHNGNPLIVYHGTGRNFDMFEGEQSHYFTDSKRYANNYKGRYSNDEGKIIEAYLSLKKPFPFDAETKYDGEYYTMPKLIEKLAFIDKEVARKVRDYDEWNNEQELEAWEILEETFFKKILLEQGYDGIIAKEDGNTTYSVFSPSQIKILNDTTPPAKDAGKPSLQIDKKYKLAGPEVDGRTVRSHVPNQSSIDATFTNYEVLDGIREIPMSEFTGEFESTARVRELAEQIKESGEINPLIVAIDKEGPYILEGGHRYDALGLIGAKSLPAMVVIDLDSVSEDNPDISLQMEAAKPSGAINETFDVPESHTIASALKGAFAPGNISKENARKLISVARTKIVDRLHPLEQLGEKPYILHRMLGNFHATLSTFLQHGKLSWKDQALTVKTKNEGFLPWLHKLGDDGRNLFYWIATQRAEQLEKPTPDFPQGRENWLTKDKREQIKDEVFAGLSPEARAAKETEFRKLNQQFQEWNRNVIRIAQESGLISQDQIDSWMKDFYMPFYRIMEDPLTSEEFMTSPHKSKKHISSQIKRLKGGEEKIGDPIENILRNWAHLLQESQRNIARSAAADVAIEQRLAEIVPPQESFRSPGARQENFIVSYQKDGKTTYLRVPDVDLFNAMSEVNIKAFDSKTLRFMGFAKRLLTMGATFTPAFRIANLLRDTLHTAVVSKNFTPFMDSAKGLAQVWKESPDYIELMASGGGFGQGWIDSGDPKAMARGIEKILKREGQGARGNILDTPRKMLDFWEKIGHASEMAARVQLYSNLKIKGETHLKAAFEARDLLDFYRSGAGNAVRVMNATIPFLNARVQGLDRMYRGAQQDKKAFFTKGAMVAAASLLLWSLFKDDDRYKELEDWEKWQYHHFWIGDGPYSHFRIPKAFEVGAIFSSLFESGANVLDGQEDYKFFLRFLKHTFTETFALNMPTVIGPSVEAYANKSAFTGRPLENMGQERLPAGERSNPWTPELLKDLGRGLGISPIKMEHIIRGHTASFGAMFLTTADAVYRVATDAPARPAISIEDVPGVGRFVRDSEGRRTKYATRYYEFAKEVNELAATVSNYRMLGEFEKARQVSDENRDALKFRKYLNRNQKRLTELRKREKTIWTDRNMTPEEKKAAFDEIAQRKKMIFKQGYDRITAK